MGFETRSLKKPKYAKYIFFAIVFIFVVVLLMNTGVRDNIWKKFRSISSLEENTFQIHGENLESCFPKFKLDAWLAKFETNRPAVDSRSNSTYISMNFIFNKIATSLNIKAAVIEPSILYCSLDSEHKKLLRKRNVSIATFNELRTTYGILNNDVVKLQNEDIIKKFRHLGYQPLFVQVPLVDWMQEDETYNGSKTYTSHIFFMYYEWNIHLVVFHKRSNYMWHAALDPGNIPYIPGKRDLLYVNHDSAYEMFSFVPLKSNSLASIYVPSNPQLFLFQIPSSRYLECNCSRAEKVKATTGTPQKHSSLSVEKFNSETLASIREIKPFFQSLLMNLWIFSGTMLGWYRQCDVIPYTTDVDFGAWASEIDDLDYLIQWFLDNKKLRIKERMGILEEALEFQLRYSTLRVDVFFMYKINNGSWASGHRPSKNYYFRYYYPTFSLCSAELLGERVNVPCETEALIVNEYGPKWKTPVSSWNYESSIWNRGPNIYWDETKKNKVFQEW